MGQFASRYPSFNAVTPGYAWKKGQWDQLFVALQEQVIEDIGSGSTIEEVEHFFGPVVVMEEAGIPELKEFLVIDGQQRITTVYLLLGIIRDHIQTKKHLSSDVPSYVKELNKHLTNEVEGNDDYLKLKVFSSKGDRLPTYRVVFGTESNPHTPFLQWDLQAFIPGASQVDEFKKYADKKLKSNYADVSSWKSSKTYIGRLQEVCVMSKDATGSAANSLIHWAKKGSSKRIRMPLPDSSSRRIFRSIRAPRDLRTVDGPLPRERTTFID